MKIKTALQSLLIFSALLAIILLPMDSSVRADGLEGFSEHREGLFVKKYTRQELVDKIEKKGGWFSSGEEFVDQLKYAGLVIERNNGPSKKETKLADLKGLSFHKKGYFEFIRYSKDGQRIFVSYMYPSKKPDGKDYMPHIFNRNALTEWDASTGQLKAVWMAEENPAKAVTMSDDERTVIYHLDLYVRESSKGGSSGVKVLKNQLYFYDLTKEDTEAKRIVSLDKDDDLVEDSYPTLDNIVLSPDARFIVFSGELKNHPGKGHGLIVDITSGKKTPFQYAYGSGTPGMRNAASHVFSPDGKRLAMSSPKSVERSGLASVGINILEVPSWNTVKQLPAQTSNFKLGSIMYSPDGRFLARWNLDSKKRNEFINVETWKTFCSIPDGLASGIFTPDSKFYLNLFFGHFDISYFDTRTCFRLPAGRYPISFGGGILKAAFSPDGSRLAVAGDVRGSNMVQVFDFKRPDGKQIDLYGKAERAIGLYAGGLKKEGEEMAREAINTDPSGLYGINYNKRLAGAGMPLSLSGELFRRAYQDELKRNNNRLGIDWELKGEGLAIKKVYEGSPAHKAGFAAGDVISGINAERILTGGDFSRIYNSLQPDRPVQFGIVRKGKNMSVPVVPVKGVSWYALNILMEFAVASLEAGQPAITMQAVGLVKGWIREGRINIDRGMYEYLLLVEASALAAMGKEGDAFALLIKHNGFSQDSTRVSVKMWVNSGAFASLLRDRRKLAAAMMVKENDLPPAPKKALTPQPFPDLSGKVIGTLAAPPVIGPPQAVTPAATPATTSRPPAGGPAATPSLPKPPPRGTVLD